MQRNSGSGRPGPLRLLAELGLLPVTLSYSQDSLVEHMLRTVEQATMRKVYLRILPFAVLTYFFCYLDRINVGFASLTMNEDLGLDPAWYGMAAGAFFWGYAIRGAEQHHP